MKGVMFWFQVGLLLLSPVTSFELCLNPSSVDGEAAKHSASQEFCPDGNTCCYYQDGATGIFRFSGCIPVDLGEKNATCCSDGSTACGTEYTCATTTTTFTTTTNVANNNPGVCQAKVLNDPLVQTLPRYQLCRTPALAELHRFPIPRQKGSGHQTAPYYSTHGPILSRGYHNVKNVMIAIHGAGRNADDYFCSMVSAMRRAQPDQEWWIITPYFLAETDAPKNLVIPNTTLRWHRNDWRFGADSVPTTGQLAQAYPVSSFAVLDLLIQELQENSPIERVVVAGHSAGGQFVQRWALISNTPHFSAIHTIVLNPSSYAYVSPLRKRSVYHPETWVLPNRTECPLYDDWEWGLANPDTAPTYVKKVILNLSLDDLIRRFASRSVVYLVGERDVCNVGGDTTTGWCQSHGLEVLCMDMWQGTVRAERHMLYFQSLLNAFDGLEHCHHRAVVPGIGHDHSLIFHSAVFGQAVTQCHTKPQQLVRGAKN